MKHTIVAFAAVILILFALNYSYAHIGDVTDLSCYCDVRFITVTALDNEIKADIGNVTAQILNGGRSIDVRIGNAYPSYEAQITFEIQNKGTLPVHVDEVLFSGYDNQAIDVEITDLVACVWINPGNILTGSETATILQGAKQGWTYAFNVEAKISCGPISHPRQVCFWKYQFCAALTKIKCDEGLTPTTLQNCLNQITQQSHVFTFTGTQNQKLKQALAILQTTCFSSIEARLKSQLLALWLNYVAGWTTGYTVGKMNANQIITGSESVITRHLTKQFEYWKNMCELFNNIYDT
jgi:hypothetical protein